MSYAILTLETLPAYMRSKAAELPAWFDAGADLEIIELSDGNLNAVYRVTSVTSSLIVKQGLPYLRVAGEAWPLSAARAGFEALALEWQNRLAQGSVPEPYLFDREMCVNIVEDLRGYQVARQPMIDRLEIAELGSSLGSFLARTLFGTSDFGLEAGEKKRLQAQFCNIELCEITEDLIFTEPFEADLLGGKLNRNHFDAGVKLALEMMQSNAALRLEVARLKHHFMTAGQALLHGDLHTGSIMVNSSGDIRVIDPEFAFYGPMGFDVGVFIANLYLNAIAQRGHAPNESEARAYQSYLLGEARACWQAFSSGFANQMLTANSVSWRNAGFAEHLLLEVLRDACGYAGCEMIRRSVGFAHVLDVDSIADAQTRVTVLEQNLHLGSRLILERHTISTYADFETFISEALK